jgi:hypothetical protein
MSLACSDRTTPQTPPPTASADMPSLEEVPVNLPVGAIPFRDAGNMALTKSGTLTFRPGADDGGMFASVDSSGQFLGRWGRRGEGPGESRVQWLLSADSAVVILATDPSAIQILSPVGELLSERRIPPIDGIPQAAVGDSVDHVQGGRIVGRRSLISDLRGPVVRTCLYRSCSRELLPADDSILDLVHVATPRVGGMRWPPFAAEAGRFVLGDGVGYRLWMFDDAGSLIKTFGRPELPARVLTQAEMQDQREQWERFIANGIALDSVELKALLATERIPHFGYASMGFDADHRLWVSGWVADSTFFDVFAEERFLGRITIDCVRERGALAIRGRWLAVMCESDDPDKALYPRLFRIVDPPGT